MTEFKQCVEKTIFRILVKAADICKKHMTLQKTGRINLLARRIDNFSIINKQY